MGLGSLRWNPLRRAGPALDRHESSYRENQVWLFLGFKSSERPSPASGRLRMSNQEGLVLHSQAEILTRLPRKASNGAGRDDRRPWGSTGAFEDAIERASHSLPNQSHPYRFGHMQAKRPRSLPESTAKQSATRGLTDP
jgi:hypothetical protein